MQSMISHLEVTRAYKTLPICNNLIYSKELALTRLPPPCPARGACARLSLTLPGGGRVGGCAGKEAEGRRRRRVGRKGERRRGKRGEAGRRGGGGQWWWVGEGQKTAATLLRRDLRRRRPSRALGRLLRRPLSERRAISELGALRCQPGHHLTLGRLPWTPPPLRLRRRQWAGPKAGKAEGEEGWGATVTTATALGTAGLVGCGGGPGRAGGGGGCWAVPSRWGRGRSPSTARLRPGTPTPLPRLGRPIAHRPGETPAVPATCCRPLNLLPLNPARPRGFSQPVHLPQAPGERDSAPATPPPLREGTPDPPPPSPRLFPFCPFPPPPPPPHLHRRQPRGPGVTGLLR
ncbi:formin-like protein 16 [Aquila chrysaetos chrysaetos]|uniref:formin-like protein 16 n=1 Tax=Aquila chrysaetos chrysaetos TaxID=223781 RepID=UPI001B7D2B8B|nr:formin-like protein 16 [Aquila chrysaetos chrysaetos]